MGEELSPNQKRFMDKLGGERNITIPPSHQSDPKEKELADNIRLRKLKMKSMRQQHEDFMDLYNKETDPSLKERYKKLAEAYFKMESILQTMINQGGLPKSNKDPDYYVQPSESDRDRKWLNERNKMEPEGRVWDPNYPNPPESDTRGRDNMEGVMIREKYGDEAASEWFKRREAIRETGRPPLEPTINREVPREGTKQY